jgi:hypothetical protein
MAGIEVRAAVVSFTALLGVGCGGGNPASTSSTARSAAANEVRGRSDTGSRLHPER